MTLRRALAVVALAALIASRIELPWLAWPFMEGGAKLSESALDPDRRWPQYPRFLEGVREHTAPGDRIAIAPLPGAAAESYAFAYYRASYFLPGRVVIPVIDPRSLRPIPANLQSVRYIAVFGESGELSVAWRGDGGTLYHR